MTNFDYYDYRTKNVTQKINNEIDFLTNNEYAPIVGEYIDYLKRRIGVDIYEPHTINRYDQSGKKYELVKMDREEYFKDSDIIMYQKPWHRLREFHKNVKIKEFVNNLDYKKKIKSSIKLENQQYLIEELTKGIKDKRYGKGKCELIYNQDDIKIESISSVYYSDKERVYIVDWD